jgi:hypothetical protein
MKIQQQLTTPNQYEVIDDDDKTVISRHNTQELAAAVVTKITANRHARSTAMPIELPAIETLTK